MFNKFKKAEIIDEAQDIVSDKTVRNKYADAMDKQEKKPMNKKVKITLIILGVLAIIALGYSVFKGLTAPKEVYGKEIAAYIGNIETSVSGSGTVVPKDKSELGKKSKGIVKEIFVTPGDEVKTGDILLTVDSTELNKEISSAIENLDLANSQLTQAQKSVDNLNIKAPFNGKVIKAENISINQTIAPGAAIATFVDDSKMKLDLFFSTAYINDIKAGASASVSIPDSLSTVSGTVESVQNIEKISSDGSVLFKVTMSMNNPGTLTKDMIATATIKTANGDAVPAESGKLTYYKEEQITAKSTGDVKAINLDEYKKYKQGDTMVSLTGDAANTALKAARRAVENAQKLVDELNKSLAESTIYAEADGIVTNIVPKVGDTVAGSGTPIVTVSNLDIMKVEINVDEIDISKVQLGKEAIVTVEQVDGTLDLRGVITNVSFEAKTDTASGTSFFPAAIEIVNDGRKLRSNMNVNYKVLSEMKENILIVPTGAVTYSEKGPAVFLKGNSKDAITPPEGIEIPTGCVLVPVEIGAANENQTEIISGIKEGDIVHVSGSIYDDMFSGDSGMAVAIG